MYDSCKRSITYLRISVTDRCNLRCTYCMPAEGIRLLRHDQILSYERIVEIARAAAGLGIEKVRLTGGEPLVRKNITHLVAALKEVPGIREVALTTNGLLLPGLSRSLKEAGLDRLNISLDSLDAERYRAITRIGRVGDALAGIDAAREAGFTRTKVNMVLIPGVNEADVGAMSRFCGENGLELQRIRRYSLQRRTDSRPMIEAERPLACSACNRIRLTADGMLKPCLFSDCEIPVDFRNPAASLAAAVRAKPRAGTGCRKRQAWQIGG